MFTVFKHSVNWPISLCLLCLRIFCDNGQLSQKIQTAWVAQRVDFLQVICVYAVLIRFTQCLRCVYEIKESVFMVCLLLLHSVYAVFMTKTHIPQETLRSAAPGWHTLPIWMACRGVCISNNLN